VSFSFREEFSIQVQILQLNLLATNSKCCIITTSIVNVNLQTTLHTSIPTQKFQFQRFISYQRTNSNIKFPTAVTLLFCSLNKYYLKWKNSKPFWDPSSHTPLEDLHGTNVTLVRTSIVTVGNEQVHKGLKFSMHCCFQSSGIWRYTHWYRDIDILKQLVLPGLHW
jgi:hypothetical protein